MDNSLTNPYLQWKKAGMPHFPSQMQLEQIRDAEVQYRAFEKWLFVKSDPGPTYLRANVSEFSEFLPKYVLSPYISVT